MGKAKTKLSITLVLLSLCTPVNGNEPLHTSYELGKVKEKKKTKKKKSYSLSLLCQWGQDRRQCKMLLNSQKGKLWHPFKVFSVIKIANATSFMFR